MNPKVNTIALINVIEGRVEADFNKLEKILLDNCHNKGSHDPTNTRYEDSICPSSPIVDHIIDQIVDDFYKTTGKRIVVENYWGHIHEKNMSTRQHDHVGCFVSSVVYIAVPKGSGSIIFRPHIDSSNKDAFLTAFPPERGRYYLFPSYLEHYVTRNNSDQTRVSLSLNFKERK